MRILLRLRKDAADRPVAPASQDDGRGMENTEEMVESDISAQALESGEAVKELKMNERTGNVTESKGPLWKTGREAGMSMKTKGVSPSRPPCY